MPNISKIDNIEVADISEVDKIAKASISDINGYTMPNPMNQFIILKTKPLMKLVLLIGIQTTHIQVGKQIQQLLLVVVLGVILLVIQTQQQTVGTWGMVEQVVVEQDQVVDSIPI